MIVPRVVRSGAVLVRGRSYVLDVPLPQVEGRQVFVEEDGVVRVDNQEIGVRTARSIPILWPTRYQWLTNATLKDRAKEAPRGS